MRLSLSGVESCGPSLYVMCKHRTEGALRKAENGGYTWHYAIDGIGGLERHF